MERGLKSVRLAEVVEKLGIKHSAIYYYAPGGKTELYVQVIERSLNRHRQGIERVLSKAEDSAEAKINAVAQWLLDQPPMNVTQMERSDFELLEPRQAERLNHLLLAAMLTPLSTALNVYADRGELATSDTGLVALSLLTLVEAVHASRHPFLSNIKKETVASIVELVLKGILPR